MIRILTICALVLASVGLSLAGAGCAEGEGSASAGGPPASYPYRVTSTVGMVTDVVRRVAGERATVTGVIGTGVDPHLFQPDRNHVAAFLNADVVFYAGLKLEGAMGDTLAAVQRRGKPVYAVAEHVEKSFLLAPPEFDGHPDPHLWMDVKGWMMAVDAVAQSLGEYDPANAAEYRANADAYLAELRKLDEYARTSIASIPERQRVLITAHDAFNYFGRAYGVEVRGIQGISTESEAGLQDINNLVGYIVERDISAVFVETSVAQRNVEALIDGARSRGKDVKIGGSLFSDAMGAPGTYEGTYVGMIDHNVTTITRALGGTAPERGLNGKLTPSPSGRGQG